MACRVRYLNSSGIHLREIPGVEALAQAFPSHWLFYASLQCYPVQGPPIEIDVMVVMDDRVLLLEIKDWNGILAQNGDQWSLNGRPRGRSPVDAVSMKAKKVKTVLCHAISGFSHYVDSRVVLTGTASKNALSPADQSQVWTLQEACSIGDPKGKAILLQRCQPRVKKAFEYEQEFERITRNTRKWGPLEAIWDGYRVVEEDFVVHPRHIWREHRAERVRDPRFKALLRIWSFDQLPPGLNSSEHRRFIADRESRAIGYLATLGSWLVEKGGILAPTGEDHEEVLTQHFQLRTLLTDWTTLDRYLERARETLSSDDRLDIAVAIIRTVAELHKHEIAHRDLGFRSIWMGGPTKVALSGLMACHMPDERTIADWYPVLRGYSLTMPEDAQAPQASTGKQRDVYSLGRMIYEILHDEPAHVGSDNGIELTELPAPFTALTPIVLRATEARPEMRFADALAMGDEFALLAEKAITPKADQTILDRAETTDIPYALWPINRTLRQDGRRHVYVTREETGRERVVKIWLGLRRGVSCAVDIAMTRLFEGVRRLMATPISGVPSYERAALSPAGPFLIYRYEEGKTLDASVELDTETAVAMVDRLICCVSALHEMDCAHGDIAEKNILVRGDGDLRLLDLFDLTAVGDGRVRTPSLCPPGCVGDYQIDRYAALTIAARVLEARKDERLADLIKLIRAELTRPSIETLEPSITALKTTLGNLRAPPPPRFNLQYPSASSDYFRSDDGTYYLEAKSSPDGNNVHYLLTGIERKLAFDVSTGRLNDARFSIASDNDINYASRRGLPVRLEISVSHGSMSGFVELIAFLKNLITPSPAQQSLEPHNQAVSPPAAAARGLNVEQYWRKLIELEEEFQPEIEITKEVGARGPVAVYTYERIGGDFDFEPDSTVEVRRKDNRKIGEVDLEQTDARSLVVRYSDSHLSTGDRVKLVDMRSKASFDRRRKAVDRVLDNRASVEGLINYFLPDHDVKAIDYGLSIDEPLLAKYDLNTGQKAAFRHLIRFGPLGLLQGPPGTGKTRFIAALVHWLVVHTGAQRILIASQSHEAVNNVIEALIDLFKRLGGRPNLLRIGSKGLTDKIRPYHTSSLRERYHVRFENAFKYRVAILATAVGLKRAFIEDAVEIERQLGDSVRHLKAIAQAERTEVDLSAEEQQRNDRAKVNLMAAFAAAGRHLLAREIDPGRPQEEFTAAFDALLAKHPGSSAADVTMARRLIELSREWSASVASSQRNFEEFLAKTRAIVTGTCVGIGQTKIRLDAKAFDWVIVDEAGRCTPGELAVPIQMGRRVLLVGDHRQLMPMIEPELLARLAKEMPSVSREDLTRSDFERAYTSTFGKDNGQILTEQYRMAPAICRMVSEIFYEPHGVHLETSSDRKPDPAFERQLPAALSTPVTWIDTSFDQRHIELSAEWNEYSFWNPAEIEATLKVLTRISEQEPLVKSLAAGSSESPIGVICMYSAQKVMMEQAFSQRAWDAVFRRMVRIDTVDSYQGKENSLVIVSLVRCNDRREVGHVSSPNRCNVALSRGKERLFVVGSLRMWGGTAPSQPIRRIVEYISAKPSGTAILRTGDL